MSAPIRGKENQEDIDKRLQYAPPWVREQRAADARPARFANSPPMAPKNGDPDTDLEPLAAALRGGRRHRGDRAPAFA